MCIRDRLDVIEKLKSEQHEGEKELVSFRMYVQQLEDKHVRLSDKLELVQAERRQATEERDGFEERQREANESIGRLESEQRSADEKFMGAQGDLLEARESVNTLRQEVVDAKATHAALLERATALKSDVRRLEVQQDDLRHRIHNCEQQNERVKSERERLLVTPYEKKDLVDAGEEGGSIEQDERQMIHSVFQFSDTLVREVMIPRIDVLTLDVETTLSEAHMAVVENGYSRIPVYDQTVDNIIGLLYAKDLLAAQNNGEGCLLYTSDAADE